MIADGGSPLNQIRRFRLAEFQFIRADQLPFLTAKLDDLADTRFVDEVQPVSGRDRRGGEWSGEPQLPFRLAIFEACTGHHSGAAGHIDLFAKHQRTGVAGPSFATFQSCFGSGLPASGCKAVSPFDGTYATPSDTTSDGIVDAPDL